MRSLRDSQGSMAPKDIMTNSHAKSILNAMNSLRKSNTLCDITLRVENTDFPAHRIVLAACSDYFCAMFTSEVTQKCLSTHCLQRNTLDYSYYLLLSKHVTYGVIEFREYGYLIIRGKKCPSGLFFCVWLFSESKEVFLNLLKKTQLTRKSRGLVQDNTQCL